MKNNRNNKKRLTYQGNLRRKKSLEGKVEKQETIVRRKQKEVRRKIEGEFKPIVKQLTPAEVSKERELLEKLRGELKVVIEGLKQSRFEYKKTTKASANKFRESRKKFTANLREKRIKRINGFISKAKEEKNKTIQEISQKLNAGGYSDDDLKRDILPILNSYNKSLPITSLSEKAIEEIKEMLKDIS